MSCASGRHRFFRPSRSIRLGARDLLAGRAAARRAAAVAALLLAVTAWAAGPGPVIRDDAGREVRLQRPATRIVSLAPHLTELLYEIGAGDRIVATTAYSDFPADARRIPRVGGLGGVDLEALVAARPDLVVAWQSGTAEADFAQIDRLGVALFESEPHALDDVATTLERFGALTGEAPRASVAAAAFRMRVAGLRATYASRPPVRVFYQVWGDPLMTIGGPQVITQVIELCGGRNVFASSRTLAPTVDLEAVIRADPELIVTASESADHRADIARWEHWPGVAAVRDRRWLFLDPAVITRHSSRILVGAEQLCRAIDDVRKARR